MSHSGFLKKFMLYCIMAGLAATLVELGSTLIAYHYIRIKNPEITTSTSATVYLSKELMNGNAKSTHLATKLKVEPKSPFVPDDLLGYSLAPGSYRFIMQLDDQQHRFSAEIKSDGSRTTSYQDFSAKKKIYIFGDSFVWGWCNNDEQTFPWMLQSRLPQYEVVNLGRNGYGNIQSLLQLRGMVGRIRADDMVVFVYADYFNPRNVAAPSWVSKFEKDDLYEESYVEKFRYPYAVVTGGELKIGYVSLFCKYSQGWCSRPDPEVEYMHDVTEHIILAGREATPAKFMVAYMSGPDDDQVISSLKQKDISVIDIRLRPDQDEHDRCLPFDRHPGPSSQYHYAKKLARGLSDMNVPVLGSVE